MSSGTLPAATYHRAQSLGAGTFGSVVAVYNEDGEEYALKLFLDDEEDSDDDDEMSGLDLSALREISILRLLRAENGHPNIIPMVDVKDAELDGEEEEAYGAGTTGCMAMAMPLYKQGNLGDAIDKGALKEKKTKVEISHGILSAVSFLHDNGIIHRDIKADNIMLEMTLEGTWEPVLIDFSLAKLVNGTIYGSGMASFSHMETEMSHTGEVGTVTYIAPEVVAQLPYGLASDLWSVGVVFLELLRNHTLEATKNKEAEKMIQEAKESLPDQPFANMIRGLLNTDPDQRLSARGALRSPVFAKFDLPEPPVKLLDIHEALSFNTDEDSDENDRPNASGAMTKRKKDPVLVKRQKMIQKVCHELDCSHPMTPYAAMVYCEQMLQLDDTLDNLSSSQALLDCVVLASKFFEKHLPDLSELEEKNSGIFKSWSTDEYFDTEGTIWMLLDHSLYPRGMKDWQE